MDWENWVNIIIILAPTVLAVILAIVAWRLKLKQDSMTGMSKELSELVIAIVEAAHDKKFTQAEILAIIKEGEDVINEAKKLLSKSA